jgi:antitoxin VapB
MGGICHILRYMASPSQPHQRPTARIGWNNRVQTVSIPQPFRFGDGVREVYIRREGDDLVLTPRPSDWSAFLASDVRASADFMSGVERLPAQERSFA